MNIHPVILPIVHPIIKGDSPERYAKILVPPLDYSKTIVGDVSQHVINHPDPMPHMDNYTQSFDDCRVDNVAEDESADSKYDRLLASIIPPPVADDDNIDDKIARLKKDIQNINQLTNKKHMQTLFMIRSIIDKKKITDEKYVFVKGDDVSLLMKCQQIINKFVGDEITSVL